MKKKTSPGIKEEPEDDKNNFEGSDSRANTVKFRGPKKAFAEEQKGNKDTSSEEKPVPAKPTSTNFMERTIWTIIMLLGFIAIILAGHFYCALLIFLLDIGMVKEILSLKRNREKEDKLPYSVALNWYFFSVAAFFFYGKLFSNKLASFTLSNQIISHLVLYHNFISFVLWIIGFLTFTLTLKKGFYRYQFRQFAWVHISMFMIIGQSAAIVNNIYEGLIWFVVPCLLVITNDTCAYIFGKLIGKTQLIELSPKKTKEGFYGGLVSSLFFAFAFSLQLCQFQFLVCPKNDLSLKPFEFATCQISNVFIPFQYETPAFPLIGSFSITLAEFQIHAIVLATFASLVSPFGGFFASGFKRAIKVKDFADIIPGHGGITDRMDCQMLTGMFAYLYVHQIVYGRINSVNGVTKFIMNQMDTKDQLLLFNELKDILYSKGLLNVTIGA